MRQQIYRRTHPRYFETYRMVRALLRSRSLDFKAHQFYQGIATYMRRRGLVTERQADNVRNRFRLFGLSRRKTSAGLHPTAVGKKALFRPRRSLDPKGKVLPINAGELDGPANRRLDEKNPIPLAPEK